MAKSRKGEPWYAGYLRSYIRKLWQWSPVRKGAKVRAQVSKNPESFRCEKCNTHPLYKGEYEINHVVACESVEGWIQGGEWSGFIERTVEAPGGAEVLCKKCHREITNEQNKERRGNKKKNGKI